MRYLGKETAIVLFYVMYFVWLFTLAFLSPDKVLLTNFVAGVLVFYFLFLRENKDIVVLSVTFILTIYIRILQMNDWALTFDFSGITSIPLWLPIAWSTTILAFRKLFRIVTKPGELTNS